MTRLSLHSCINTEIVGGVVNTDYALGGTRDDREERESVPQNLHGLIIGVGGERVKELERQSGARICFETDPEPCMVLRGTPQQRARARLLAKNLVNAISEQTVEVPRHMWSAIIGQRGARIREMELGSGARMVLRDEPDGTPVLAVHGTPEARKKALELANAVMERETQESFPLDPELAPLFVGRKGFTVKMLEEETDAWIRIERIPETIMIIKGTAPQREKALSVAIVLEGTLQGIARDLGCSDIGEWEQRWEEDAESWEERVGNVIQAACKEWKEERIQQKKIERGLLFTG